MDRWKAELGRGREKRRRVEERRSEKRKSQKKEDADAWKGRKVAKHCVFPMIWGSGGSKSRLAKAAGAEPAGQMRDEKLHAVVARSTFRSQNVQNTSASDHFWKLRCRKSARRCGAKHISKSKCTKHQGFGPLLEVQMLLRVAGARDCAPCQKWAKREGFVAFSTTTTTIPHYTPHYNYNYNYTFTTFHYTTLHYTPLHYATLKYTQLPPPQLHYATLHYTTLHYTTLPSTTLHYLPLHYITLHFTPLHYTTLHYTTFHYTTLRYVHYTPLHYNYNYATTLHYTPLH